MVAQGLFSIGGIASGLDTNDIVNQLMQLERQPITRLEQRQQTLNTSRDAWGEITTRLSGLRSATDNLRRATSFDAFTSVDSSQPDAVSVSRNGRVDADSQVEFTVTQLATRMQQTSGERFQGRDAAIGDRTLEITTNDGAVHDITADLADGATLDDLVAAVNGAGIGVSASTLQVSEGQFQLVLSADQTGAAAAFSVDGAGWNLDADPEQQGFHVTRDAADAVLDVGGIEVTRSSNTISDLLDGATIDLRATTTGPVTVTAQRDIDGAVEAVTGMVGEINKVFSTINELTAYDAETGEAGPLQGQFAATLLGFDLRSAVTAPIEGMEGVAALASNVGLSVDRNGVVQLDEDRLRAAFEEDFAGTAERFVRSGTPSDSDLVSSVSDARDTQAGTYEVEVNEAASVARATGAVYDPPTGQPKAFKVVGPNGRAVTVMIDTDRTTAAQAAAMIRQAVEEAGVDNLEVGVVEQVVEEGPDEGTTTEHLEISTTNFGSRAGFTINPLQVDAEGELVLDADGQPVIDTDPDNTAFGLAGTYAGTDVVGTIDGEEATGRGRTLIADTGPAAGLEVSTARDLDGPAAFDVRFTHGIAGAMDLQLQRAEGSRGSISRARASLESQANLYQNRIDAFEERLRSREITLRRQFVALETAMDQFNSQSQWLDGQINQLNAMRG